MSLSRLSVPKLIEAGTVAVTNLENEADLLALLTPYGYDAAAIAHGRTLLDDLVAKSAAQTAAKGRHLAAQYDLTADRTAFHEETYIPHNGIARLVFRGEASILTRLGLNERRSRVFAAWRLQAEVFYTNLLADSALVAGMAARGITEPTLQAARAFVADLQDRKSAVEDLNGRATGSTAERKAARKALAAWLADLRDLAKVALSAQPEWLERLGFLHKGEG